MERKTQLTVVKEWLLSGKTITSNEARDMWAITRLADLIFKLRKEGLPIISINRPTITKLGGKTWYSEYKLLKGDNE